MLVAYWNSRFDASSKYFPSLSFFLPFFFLFFFFFFITTKPAWTKEEMILFSWLFDRHKLSVIFITWMHSFSVIFFTSSSGSLRWLCSNSKLEYFNSCSFGGLYSLVDQGKLLYKPERICELPLLIKNTFGSPLSNHLHAKFSRERRFL